VTDHYYSWAWTPDYVRIAAQQDERTAGGIILPASALAQPQADEAALAHFAGLNPEELNWIWLFEDQEQAVALRLLPDYCGDEDKSAGLVSATLPRTKPPQSYLQILPTSWLLDWSLLELGISEIWLGFSYKLYAKDRRLRASAQVFAVEEFLEKVRKER
jgi:hypothetical protein